MIMRLFIYFDWIYDYSVSSQKSCINFIQIEHVVLELLRMFYFYNILNISNSWDETYMIYISFDWKFDFK